MADQPTKQQPAAPQTNRDQHPNMYYSHSEWVQYGPKQVPGTPNPLQEKVNKILSPGGLVSPRMGQPVRISDSFINNPFAAQVRYNNQAKLLKLPQPGPDGEQYAIMGSDKQVTYWDNPQRVARYYNMIRTAPPDWQPPEWMDKQQITDAYSYLKYVNKGKPWTDWLAISDDDPAKDFFKAIPTPPVEVLWPSEKGFAEQYLPYSDDEIKQQQIADWNDLPRWQQWWESVAVPQSQLQDRPEITKITASGVQAGIAGLGALGISSMVGGGIGFLVGGPAGVLAGAGVGSTIGKVLFPVVAGANFYQTYTGTEVPVMNDVLNAFDVLAIGLKRGIGVASQDRSQVFKDWAHMRAAWQAGEATYAVSDIDSINAFARILDFVDFNSNYFEVDPNKLAQDNQVWKISQGYTEPVDITDPRNAEALNWLREEILNRDFETNKEVMDFVNEFKNRYGDTGIGNDLIYESLLDPANIVGFASGKLGKGYAKLTGNEGLAHAFDATTGSPIIDALPFGIQQLAEAVTGVEGSKGPLAALDYYKNMIRHGTYPASMWDMPEDMRSQFNTLVKKGYKPEDIQVSGKLLTWNEDGVQKIFEGSREANPPIPSIEELSKFEKNLAGIDETYGLKELRPTQDLNWFQRLVNLTPASQAHLMLNLFHSQMAALMDAAHGDVNTMVKLWKQAAGVSPVAVGDVGEAILKSPAMRAVQEAIRSGAMDNDMLDNMMMQWISGEKPRLLLQKISKALNQTPAETIDQLKTNPDNLIARINDIAPQVGDAKFLRDTLGVFTGDDHIPWNEREFQTQLMITMADKMDTYLTDHFGLKPDPTLMRVSKALKGVQSLVLLGLNPAYFLNNYVNNVVTRAAVGVMGYMTPRQINEFLDRFGITPPRIDTGVSPTGEALYGGRAGISKAMDAGDALSKATKVIQNTNKKLGIFSRLSSDMERMESRQSTVIAMKRFLGKSWKRGKGFRKLHPLTEATLDRVAPGMKEVLYQAVEAGLNMDEVEGAIFGEYVKPQIDGIADQVDKILFPNTPGLGKQMLVETGILDELRKKIANAQDASDVDIAFDDMINELEKYIDQKIAQDIIDRAESVSNIVKNERIPAVLSLYGDMEIMIAQHWIDGRRRLDELFAKRSEPGTNYDAWQAEYRAEEMRQSREWERVYDVETQTYAGIVKTLGVESEYSKAFIEQLDIIHKGWKDFHDLRRKKLDKFFDGFGRKDKETYEQYQNRRNLEWNILQDELDDLYQKQYDIERKAQMEMDRLFAEGYRNWADWKVDKAIAWREKIRDIRYKMYQAQRQQRAATRNMNTADRDAAYVDFNPLYNRMIADMKQLEQDGAFELMNEAKPAKTVEGLVGEEAFEPRSVLNPKAGEQILAETPPVSEAPVTVEPEQTVHQSIYDLANEYSIPTATKDGKPMDTVMRNVINTYLKNHGQPVLTKETDINSLDPDTIINAFEEHKKRHEIEKVKKDIVSIIKAQDIIDLADKQVREAKLKQAGYLNRMEIEEKFRSIPNITELEVKAVMLILDHRADRWARQNGSEPSDATRDAWYATRIKDVLSGEGDIRNVSLLQKTPDEIVQKILEKPEPFRVIEPSQDNWDAEFGTTKVVQTPIGSVKIGENQYAKLIEKKREKYIGLIRPTLENPSLIVREQTGTLVFAKSFDGDEGKVIIFASIGREFEGIVAVISSHQMRVRQLIEKIKGGELLFDATTPLDATSSMLEQPSDSVGGRLDTSSIADAESDINSLFQEGARGSVSFLADGRAVIHALNASDVSTLVHEIGHIFRRDLGDNQLDTVAKMGGLKDAAEFKDLETKFWDKTATEEEAAKYRQVEEMFAQGWERYLAEGYAPTPALRSLFKQFTDWMLNIYKNLRKVSGRVTGFEKSQIGVDIRATVDGVSLRNIFDDLLVDRPDRPKDYRQLLTRKMEDIKSIGRNWRLDDIALKKRADKELIANLLSSYKDIEEATRAAESDDLITLADGTQVEPEVIYDAITRIDSDPELNPWTTAPKPKVDIFSAIDVLKSGANDPKAKEDILKYLHENAMPFRELRLNDENWIKEFGEKGEIESAIGKLKIGIGLRESILKEKRAAFWGLIKPTVQSPSLVIAKPDGSFLYIQAFIGKKKLWNYLVVAKDKEGNATLVSAYPDQWNTMRRDIGSGDLLYPVPESSGATTPNQGSIQISVDAGGRPDTDTIPQAEIENKIKTFAHQSTKESYEAGNPIPIDQVAEIELSHNDVPAESKDIKTFQRTGSEPIPEQGTYVAKGYHFRHGDADIVAAVYKDGELIAYIPDNYNADFIEMNDGKVRILGLSPNDPSIVVYEIDGEIRSNDVYGTISETERTPKEPKAQTEPEVEIVPQEKVKTFKSQAEEDRYFKSELLKAADQLKAARLKIPDLTFEQLSENVIKFVEKKPNKWTATREGDAIIMFEKDRSGTTTYRIELTESGWNITERPKNYGAIGEHFLGEELGLKHKPVEVKITVGNTTYKFINEGQVNNVYKRITGKPMPGYEYLPTSTRTKRSILFQSAADDNPEGRIPLGGTPEPQPSGMPLHEVNASTIRPMLDRMKEEYKRSMQPQFKINDLDPVSQREIKKWLGTVRSDMASTKLAAINYGEQFRDAALLNYSRRYGVDDILDMVYPYQFWYTRTMMNWAKRMIDKPGWYAMYARLQRMQDELEKKGIPTRLRGKVRFPMPWLPEWTGRGLWSDPMKAIFPFDQFGQPLEQYASNKNQIEKRAESILNEMVEKEEITYIQAQNALVSKNDAVWKEAYKQAEIELDKGGNPINLVGMMMQPALWWTMPINIAQGKPEKISPLPVTRTGQAIRTTGSGTIAEPVTNFIGGLLAGPEEFVRKKAGLSEFGQWGDYYIDRMLANMAADGTIDANTAQIAMIQRSGPAFEEARQRIAYEQALRIPGTGPLLALKEGAKPGEVLSAIIQTIFPGGLFPEGEMKQRNLYVEYNNAWRKLKTGDPDAVNKFFENHPEYESRLALYDEPEQRLRQFLISSVWDRWFAIDKPNRTKVVQAFGQEFEDFLNKETRDEENIDIQLLANWAQAMGALLPQTEELKDLPESTEMDFYDQEMVNNIQAYQDERDSLFPNYYALQTQYYALPAGTQRKAFLRQFPQLKQYWVWKDGYKKEHPELAEYFDDLKQDNDTILEDAINDMDPVMMNQLFYYSQGKQMTQGGIAEIQRLWRKYGQPKGMTLDEYISFMARAIYQ